MLGKEEYLGLILKKKKTVINGLHAIAYEPNLAVFIQHCSFTCNYLATWSRKTKNI